MPSDPSTGVLVFDTEASVQHVDPAAAALLNADREALAKGTASVLNTPVSTSSGASYTSLSACVEEILENDRSTQSIVLSENQRAHIRVTYGPDGPRGVAVTVHSPSPAGARREPPPKGRLERFKTKQTHFLERIASGAPLHEVLSDLVTFIEGEHPGVFGSVLLHNPGAGTLHHGAAPSLPDEFIAVVDGLPTGPSSGSCGAAAHSKKLVIAENIAHDDRWTDYRDIALKHDLRAGWSMPILGANDEVLGTFALYYEAPRVPSDFERVLIEEASRIASVAIEHDRQKRELQIQQDQLRRLVENAQPVVFILDDDGTFLLSEGEDLAAVGLEPGEVVGESVYDLYADHPTLLEHIDRALDGETIDEIVELNEVVFDIWYAPYYDRTGTVQGCMGMAVDISDRREIEARLRRQKEWLQSITENISGGIYRSTEDGLVYANQAFLDLFGYESLDEMTDADPNALYADPTVRTDLLRREAEQGELDGVEVEYRRKDGSTFTGLLRSKQVLDDQGKPRYFDGVVTDITEQKARERKLREQGQKMKALYETSERLLTAESPEAVADRVQHLLNEAFDYPLTGISFVDGERIVPERVSMDEDHEMPPVEPLSLSGDSLAAQALRSGTATMVENLRETNNEVSYGDLQSAVCVPIGEDGIIYLGRTTPGPFDPFDLHLIDILAKKAETVLVRIENEAQLHASEQRFRGLFEEAALGIALLDADGHIVDANSELGTLLGYEPAALQGRSFATLIHPDDRNSDRPLFEEVVDGSRERYEQEQRYRRKNETVFWGHLTVSQHKGPGPAEIIAMVNDVTDRKRYERELKSAKREAEEASRLKSALLTNMSHEIRTPLTSMIGFAGTLHENLSGANARFAKLVHQGAERLMNTLDSVMQLSKLEAGMIDSASARVDLVSIVRETVELFQPDAESAGVVLQFDPAVDSLEATVDSSAFQRVLSNLLSNALKFTPGGGTVTVRMCTRDDHAVLTVADTGIGISDTFRPRLFDAFTQESEGLKREHEGSGLGLAIAKRLVDLMEGDIDVQSTKGEGTTFTVRLPLDT